MNNSKNKKKSHNKREILSKKNNNSWEKDPGWRGTVYKLPNYFFFIGLILLISYLVVYFNPFTNHNDYNIYGPKSRQLAISITGFILSFTSVSFLIMRNLIRKNTTNFLTLYSLLILLLLAEIYILFIIDIELRKEPQYVNVFKSKIDIKFFNNWINSIRGALIFSFLFLYILITKKNFSMFYILIILIFISLSFIPAVLLIINSDEVYEISNKYQKYDIDGNFGWYTNRDLSYYTGFASIFIGILYIYTIYNNYNYKNFVS